jgi:hypothetical protein
MTVAVNMSRDDQQGKQNSKRRPHPWEQAQWIRHVRSGPWPVTMLELKKGIQDVPLHLVGWLLKLWEDKWATENENEIVTWSHKSWQQILQNELANYLYDNYWATKSDICCEIGGGGGPPHFVKNQNVTQQSVTCSYNIYLLVNKLMDHWLHKKLVHHMVLMQTVFPTPPMTLIIGWNLT